MALDDTLWFEWHVRPDGDDLNGGGFYTGGSGTNHANQAAAQLSVTDGATSGIGVTTLTSATGGFTAAMVGNFLQIASGTNYRTDLRLYRITAYTDTNTITIDASPDDGFGGLSGASLKVGGSWATPGMIAYSQGFGSPSYRTHVWIKSGTYTLTTSATDAGGKISKTSGNGFLAGYYETPGDLDGPTGIGSANRPVIEAGGISVGSWICDYNVSSGRTGQVRNLIVDAENIGGVHGFAGSYCQYFNCEARNCDTYGFYGIEFVHSCAAVNTSGSGTGFYYVGNHRDCIATGHSNGYRPFRSSVSSAYNCIAYDNANHGFYSTMERFNYENCVAYGNGGDGFNMNNVAKIAFACCVAVNNTGSGWDNSTGAANSEGVSMYCCASYGNASRDDGNAVYLDVAPIILTSDPFTDGANGDFTLNDTSGGGSELQQQGLGVPGQGVVGDVGAVPKFTTVGGSSTYHPFRSRAFGA